MNVLIVKIVDNVKIVIIVDFVICVIIYKIKIIVSWINNFLKLIKMN